MLKVLIVIAGVQLASSSWLLPGDDQADWCPAPCTCTQVSTGEIDVDCSNRGLVVVPADGKWPNKTVELRVNFDDNKIKTITGFPSDLNIVELSFRRNDVSRIVDGAFQNLTTLRILDLSFNNLTSTALKKETFQGTPGQIYSYNQLYIDKLDLTGNKIHSLDKDVFDFVERLGEVILDENELTELDVPTTMALASTTALESLSLAQTGLRDLPQGAFNSLRNLKTLNLANNFFEFVPQSIGSARRLENLNLNGNPIHHLDEESFVGLESLVTLNISAMPVLEEIRPKAFTPLKKLRVLRCSNNEYLEDINALAFEDIADSQAAFPIRELHLGENALTTLSSALVPWDKLEWLDIQGNPWNCDCYIKWMTSSFIDHLERMNPSLTFNILCDEPPRMHGETMVAAALDPEQFVCTGKPKAQTRRSSSRKRAGDDDDDDKSAGATVAVIMTGILLIVLSIGALMWMMHGRKRRGTTQVQYTRAPDEDASVDA